MGKFVFVATPHTGDCVAIASLASVFDAPCKVEDQNLGGIVSWVGGWVSFRTVNYSTL